MSVFTFDPNGADPARAASPWLRPADPRDKSSLPDRPAARKGAIGTGLLSDYQITRLEPEPQDGPTEYKLHLLLRPRRKYEQISTASRISGSTQRPPSDAKTVKSATAITGSSTTSAQTRQNRLEHLTTQLLWRLQQSCPYHAGSAAPQLVIPQLPDERIARDSPIKLGKVLPGLEVSRGALYEIGVADDGTLAGLTKDELDESLYILKVMAASLGCAVNVLRRLEVGHCEWIEPGAVEAVEAKLWVAEALVTPDLRPRDAGQQAVIGRTQGAARSAEALPDPKQGPLSTDQLRVTLTGPTTSGKSTLLGTLSTGTLDNGRGKGRLGLLKHLHEVTTGITSSVTQELVGYERDNIINYAHSGIESWIDIHDYTKSGRLVYLVDSAGHPRYRRTILRGIVGWAPHWTLLCIAADSAEFGSAVGGTSSALDVLGPAGASVDLASAHLDLCLRLCLPLVIVVTKLDLASRQSVKNTLGKILSSVKRAGRTPMMVKTGPAGHTDLSRVSEEDDALVGGIVDALGTNDGPLSIIPIVLTSAVDGRGIGSLHALLRKLPLPPTPTSHDYIGAALNPEQPACLFHIEDKYNMPASCALATSDADQDTELGTVVAGYLRFGSLSIGDKVVVGPFPAEDDSSPDTTSGERSPGGPYGLSLSHPSSADLNRAAFRNTVSASAVKGEWHTASIASIRNLRMPVQTLTAGQVGSIGIIFYDSPAQAIAEGEARYPSTMPRLRKGMVLAVPSQHMVSSGLLLQAVSGLTAVFNHSNREVGSLSVGSLVNIYVASVRTAARVSRVSRVKTQDDGSRMATDELDDIFSLTDDMDGGNNMEMGVDGEVEVQLDLMSTREWIELGSRILVLEGGSKDRSGLEGYVGKVVEIVE